MKKKLIPIILALTFSICCAFGFAACGDGAGDNNGGVNTDNNGGNTDNNGGNTDNNGGNTDNNGGNTDNNGGNTQTNTHNMTHHEATVTCTADGNIEYWSCSDCGKNFSDQAGEHEISEIAATAFGHSYNKNNVCTRCETTMQYTEGLAYEPNSDGETYYVKGIGEATDLDIVIPYYNEGKPVTKIGEDAFMSCSNITSITIPDSVTSIGGGAFYTCSGLTSITIPDSVTSIGSGAFNGCIRLKSITVPDSVTSFGAAVFYRCYIQTATVPAIACDSIGNSDLKSLTITSGESISSNAFSGCSSLTNITIPDSVTSIGSNAFKNCPIETATIPAIACSFIKNIKLTSVNITSGESIERLAFQNCSNLTSVTIGNGVEIIGDYAFRRCYELASITIPDSVTSIGKQAFEDCRKLASITVGSENATYKSVDNCLLSKDGETLFLGCKNSVIPDGVKIIADYAFSGCSEMTGITIPDGVKTIGNYAFYGCSSFTSITVPDGVTYIGEGAFEYCTGLESVTLGNGVTSIGSSAFFFCSELQSITIPHGVTDIGCYMFSRCSSLTSVTIPDSVNCIDEYMFEECSSLTSIVYSGDKDQWKDLSKYYNWNYNTGDYIIICEDGKLDKNGNEIE